MIKAVIFDFGGVVFKDKKEYEGPKGKLAGDQSLWAQARIGQIPDEKVFEDISRVYNVDSQIVLKWLLSKREPNKEVLDIISQLEPGIKKAILNNGLKTLFHKFLDKYNLKDKFDILVNSGEEKIEKPNPEIYLRTCERLGVKPEECLYLDDNPKLIEGAKNVGMETILFEGYENLKEEVVKRELILK